MRSLSVREIVIFPMLGAVMFASTFVMKALPNIHLLALLIIAYTRVYRVHALIPIYIYVALEGVIQGFSLWWVPYLYIWTVLWAAVMLLPRRMSGPGAAVVYCVLGGLHGALYGTLWAPAQALFFGLSARATLTWIVAGLPFDLIHGVSNLAACTLALPLIALLTRLSRN